MSETLSERLRAAAKRSPDWDLGPLLRSAADALDAVGRREEAFGLLLAYAECDRAYDACMVDTGPGRVTERDMVKVFRRHGFRGNASNDTVWAGWLDNLQTRAIAAAQTARGEGVGETTAQ